MKIPRDVSGAELEKALAKLEYVRIRQAGSHVRMKTELCGTHKVTIPMAKSIPVGTLHDILKDVADHHKIGLPELVILLCM